MEFNVGQRVMATTSARPYFGVLVERFPAGDDAYWIMRLDDGTEYGTYQNLLSAFEEAHTDTAPVRPAAAEMPVIQHTAAQTGVESTECKPDHDINVRHSGTWLANVRGFTVRVLNILTYSNGHHPEVVVELTSDCAERFLEDTEFVVYNNESCLFAGPLSVLEDNAW